MPRKGKGSKLNPFTKYGITGECAELYCHYSFSHTKLVAKKISYPGVWVCTHKDGTSHGAYRIVTCAIHFILQAKGIIDIKSSPKTCCVGQCGKPAIYVFKLDFPSLHSKDGFHYTCEMHYSSLSINDKQKATKIAP